MPSILLNGKVVGKWKKKNSTLTLTFFDSVSDKEKNIINNEAEQLWLDLKKIVIDS